MPNTTIADDDVVAHIGDVLDQGVQPLYVESGGWEEIWITCKLDACICFCLLLLFELARRKTSVYLCSCLLYTSPSPRDA